MQMNISELQKKILDQCSEKFSVVEKISFENTAKILDAFRDSKISDAHFRTTSGYGYDDLGREKLEEVYSKIFKAESALVRTQFASGTHALATVLFGILRPGDELISLTGTPYDTMQSVIHSAPGNLTEFGIEYRELPIKKSRVDFENISEVVTRKTKMVLIQRSRGYSSRDSLSIEDIEIICDLVHKKNPACICFIDNCYGEFVETREPIEVGADIVAGSLIKNPGGGLVSTGGYIIGRKDLVELSSYRLTAPGVGSEVGATLADNRLAFQGLFLAPHVVSQALKGSIFAAGIFSELGYNVYPKFDEPRFDIIQAIDLESKEKLLAFCRGIQANSPVDSFAVPTPWDMPGYDDQIVMAAGTFVQGASIELSADAPIREPFRVYMQGGLTFEHAMLGILGAVDEVLKV